MHIGRFDCSRMLFTMYSPFCPSHAANKYEYKIGHWSLRSRLWIAADHFLQCTPLPPFCHILQNWKDNINPNQTYPTPVIASVGQSMIVITHLLSSCKLVINRILENGTWKDTLFSKFRFIYLSKPSCILPIIFHNLQHEKSVWT